MYAILFLICMLVIIVLCNRYYTARAELTALRKQNTQKEPEPEPPAMTIGSNPDGQLSFSYPDGRTAYATLRIPFSFTRKESLGLALGILKNQGVEGIEAAKALIGTDEK